LIVTALPVGMVDPGGHPERILAEVERRGLAVKYVLNTHAHFDHTDANGAIVAATGASLALHPDDLPLLRSSGGAALFGLRADPSPLPDVELHDGDQLEIGQLRFQVLYTPGHTPGHVSFYEPTAGALFDGDVLFRRGIGRTDLPGGDWTLLMDSIQRVLFALPDETVVYSGHGPATTIGEEKRLNPWLR
jgi:hydroxyacylglutathione hydrolase